MLGAGGSLPPDEGRCRSDRFARAVAPLGRPGQRGSRGLRRYCTARPAAPSHYGFRALAVVYPRRFPFLCGLPISSSTLLSTAAGEYGLAKYAFAPNLAMRAGTLGSVSPLITTIGNAPERLRTVSISANPSMCGNSRSVTRADASLFDNHSSAC